jgi:hypothetical protein
MYDVSTAKETLLAEARSVDDQVEWLDDSDVLYGLTRAGTATATSDVWTVPADGDGTPRVLVHDAWSPAVVRRDEARRGGPMRPDMPELTRGYDV